MRLRSIIVGCLTLFVGFSAVTKEAQATTLMEMTTEEMVDMSDLVLRGTVSETWTEMGENGRIWTRAQIDVDHMYKGDGDIDTVVVDQLGGHHAGVTMHIEGATRFSIGEEIVIFLDELESGRISPLGMFTGKWTVRMDPYTHVPIVQRFTVGAREVYDHRFLPLPRQADRIFLSDLETMIIDRVRTGPDIEVQ